MSRLTRRALVGGLAVAPLASPGIIRAQSTSKPVKIGLLSDTMRSNQQLMLRIAETQSALGPALQRLGERGGRVRRERVRATITGRVRLSGTM